MKAALSILCSLLIATTSLHAGSAINLKATVSGTVQTQILISPTDGRVHTTILNNKRIFQEFQVSKDDYELVFQVGSATGFFLVPKHTSAALPTITVCKFGSDTQQAADTKARVVNIVADADKGTAANLFQDLAGEISGAVHYVGATTAPVFTHAVFHFTGHGRDITANSDAALLKFKVTAQGPFTPAP